MNYYKRNIGDYAAATRHLSILEHGAYTLLMDRYYSDEKGLPGDPLESARIIGARTKQEIAAVKAVLKDFFELVGDSWTQSRCEEEIKSYKNKAMVNRDNGKGGGRPKRIGTQVEPKNNPDGFVTETQTEPLRPNDGTLTNNHKPREDSEDEASSAQRPAGQDPPDPRKQLFDLGKTLLGTNAGGLISKAIASAGERNVGAILGEMATRQTADPRSYFSAAVRAKGEGSRFKTA